MSDGSDQQRYSAGVRISVCVELQDDSGIYDVKALFVHSDNPNVVDATIVLQLYTNAYPLTCGVPLLVRTVGHSSLLYGTRLRAARKHRTSYQAGRATKRVTQSSSATNRAINNIAIRATIRNLPNWKAPPDAEVLLRPISLRPNLPRMVLPFPFVTLLLNLLYRTTRIPELVELFRPWPRSYRLLFPHLFRRSLHCSLRRSFSRGGYYSVAPFIAALAVVRRVAVLLLCGYLFSSDLRRAASLGGWKTIVAVDVALKGDIRHDLRIEVRGIQHRVPVVVHRHPVFLLAHVASNLLHRDQVTLLSYPEEAPSLYVQ